MVTFQGELQLELVVACFLQEFSLWTCCFPLDLPVFLVFPSSHRKGVAVNMHIGNAFGFATSCVPLAGRVPWVTHLSKSAQSPDQQRNASQNPSGSTFYHRLICSRRYFGEKSKDWHWSGLGRGKKMLPGGGKCLCMYSVMHLQLLRPCCPGQL